MNYLPGLAARRGLLWPDRDASSVRDVLTRYADPSDASRVCVVLVDGLGQQNLEERLGHAPTLRSGLAAGDSLLAPYPSTTSASIASFGTGQSPGRTGMLGYTVRDPASGVLGNLVQWTGLPQPEQWQPERTVFERLSSRGIRVTSIGPERFRDSGMTRASLRGASYVGAEAWSDRLDAAAKSLRDPGLTYVYWGDLDKAGHHYGWQSNQWCSELEKVDAGIRYLLRSVPRETTVLLTADHGMIDVDRSLRWDASDHPVLRRGVVTTAGEPRALHVHVDESAQDVATRWRETLGEHALVALRDEAIAAGLFGEVLPAMVPRIGDVVVAMAGAATVVDSRTQTPASMSLIGVHGSLSPWEMRVPLLRWG